MTTTPRTQIAARGLLHPAFGPVVRVELTAPAGQRMTGVAVLDTGASRSAIDQEAARQLLLPSPGAASWLSVSSAGGRDLAPLRTATVRVGAASWCVELDLIEAVGLKASVQGYDILALLGWDYLCHTTLTCNGPAGTFTLEVPAPRTRKR